MSSDPIYRTHDLDCHSDLLVVALHSNLFLFAEDEIERKVFVEKKGRPYLHYLLTTFAVPDGLDRGRISMIKLLLSKGCPPEREFYSRTTWDYFLAYLLRELYPPQPDIDSTFQVILLFLEFGADPNQKTFTWRHNYHCSALYVLPFTPRDQSTLHTEKELYGKILPFHRLVSILFELLKRGADVNTEDSRGRSAIQMAQESWPEAVDLLRSYASPRSITAISLTTIDLSERCPLISAAEETKTELKVPP
jgi:hypothetical protein